jgi:hypothetical protein
MDKFQQALMDRLIDNRWKQPIVAGCPAVKNFLFAINNGISHGERKEKREKRKEKREKRKEKREKRGLFLPDGQYPEMRNS